MNSKSNEYIPGTCNIGIHEIKRRRNNAIWMAVIASALIAVFLITNSPKWWRLIVFFPLTGFAVGIQQWYFKFCVYFGLKGLFNFQATGTTDSVEAEEFRRKDLAKAWKMIGSAIAFGVIMTLLFYSIS